MKKLDSDSVDSITGAIVWVVLIVAIAYCATHGGCSK